jgi:hypothetical protein
MAKALLSVPTNFNFGFFTVVVGISVFPFMIEFDGTI